MTDHRPQLDEDGTPLVKVRAEFRYAGSDHGERFWARPLGGDLHELRNVPWYAYRLNFGDVVRATAAVPEEVPLIREVVERSGHRTLRVFFAEERAGADQQPVLARLSELRAFHERAGERLLALDVEPDADYETVFRYLAGLEEQGVLQFEEAWPGEEPGFDEPLEA